MSVLFETTSINSMQLKNRFVRSATHEGMADERGLPTPSLFDLYQKLSQGGVGLIITGYACVSRDGKSNARGMLCIDSDEHVSAFQRLTSHVHEGGAKIAMQIAHCGGQTTADAAGTRPMAPSPVKYRSTATMPREMTEADINRVIDSFGHAARRVRESGFDALQLHAAHGYLLSAFLCPHTNRRRDRWGGPVTNRMRIISAIYDRCRREVGYRFPLLIKINGRDAMRRGLKLQEATIMASMMGEMGFDGIEVSCGIGDDGWSGVRGDFSAELLVDDLKVFEHRPLLRMLFRRFGKMLIRPLPFTQAYNRDCARAIKKKITMPVLCVGGITEPATMEDIITSGDADYISLCRSLVFDPSWPLKIMQGSRDASGCIHCNHCLFYSLIAPLKCYYGRRYRRVVPDT